MFDKPMSSESDSGKFLKITSGQTVRGVLRGEVKKYVKHWADRTQNRFMVNMIVRDESGKYVAKILDQGPQVHDQLVKLQNAGWKINETAIELSKTGSGRDTQYTVSCGPNSKLPASTVAELQKVTLLPLTVESEPTPSEPVVPPEAPSESFFDGPGPSSMPMTSEEIPF